MSSAYPFPLCIQLPAQDPASASFEETLALCAQLGLYGVELNLLQYASETLTQTLRLLRRHKLRLTMVATGAYAVKNGLSMSSSDETMRRRTVQYLTQQAIPAAALAGAGVICGYIKGAPGQDAASAAQQLRRTLAQIEPVRAACRVPVYLEATNRRETCLVRQLADAAPFLRADALGGICVLPDTYHMNLEERCIEATLIRALPHYKNLHISDSNRRFPGFGSLSFARYFAVLRALGYSGTITIEGRTDSLSQDLTASCAYLRSLTALCED